MAKNNLMVILLNKNLTIANIIDTGVMNTFENIDMYKKKYSSFIVRTANRSQRSQIQKAWVELGGPEA